MTGDKLESPTGELLAAGELRGVAASVSNVTDGGRRTRSIPLVQRGSNFNGVEAPPLWGRLG